MLAFSTTVSSLKRKDYHAVISNDMKRFSVCSNEILEGPDFFSFKTHPTVKDGTVRTFVRFKCTQKVKSIILSDVTMIISKRFYDIIQTLTPVVEFSFSVQKEKNAMAGGHRTVHRALEALDSLPAACFSRMKEWQ